MNVIDEKIRLVRTSYKFALLTAIHHVAVIKEWEPNTELIFDTIETLNYLNIDSIDRTPYESSNSIPRWKTEIHSVKDELKKQGFINNSLHGVWELTETTKYEHLRLAKEITVGYANDISKVNKLSKNLIEVAMNMVDQQELFDSRY